MLMTEVVPVAALIKTWSSMAVTLYHRVADRIEREAGQIAIIVITMADDEVARPPLRAQTRQSEEEIGAGIEGEQKDMMVSHCDCHDDTVYH
jgi:hypothetical protein